PNPDLVRTLRDRITHHAIQPNNSQDQSHSREDREQGRAKARSGNRRRQVLIHRLHGKHRHVLIHRRDLFAYSGNQTARLVARLDDTDKLRERPLRLRHVISRRRISAQTAIPDITDNADDLAPRRVFILDSSDSRTNTLSNGFFVREKIARKLFCNNHYRSGTVLIAVVEVASLDDGNTHRLEVIDAGGKEVR